MKNPPDRTSIHAPGWPGIPPRWTSSAKSGVGTALGAASRVWFTLSHGILDEVYYPRVDSACTRDLGLIVTDGVSYCSEEKRHAASSVSLMAEGVPAFHLRNIALDGRYQIDKDIVSDPSADVVLQRVRVHRAAWRAVGLSSLRAAGAAPRVTAARATPHGSATTRARRCCTPSATATRWRWRARRRGCHDRSASSGSRTAGSSSKRADASSRPTSEPRTATSR